jgi:16S rRNA (cytosine967-C5)-methyltransferase
MTGKTGARGVAFEILWRVELGGYADRLLDAYLRRHSGLDRRERGLLTELVYGVPRLRGRLDFALASFCRQPLAKLEPKALLLLRLGAYQLLQLDRVPAHAAVGTTVALAHQVGMSRVAGLVNGVLRSLAREREGIAWPPPERLKEYLQHVCSLPKWLVKELLSQFPNAESRALGEALAEPAPLTLRVNTLKTSRPALLDALRAAGHRARPCRFADEGVMIEQRGVEPLPGDVEGLYQVQDEASMLVAHLLGVAPGECLLDACAAPGGKTTHLAALADNRARITALDKHPQRVALIRQGAQRIGCEGIEARCWDLRQAPEFLAPNSFDAILLDAPCSGLGVLRRNPESRWSRRSRDVTELAQLQRTLLGRVAPLLRPGGRLLYSVCTFTRAETDAVVDDFLSARPDFALDDLRPRCRDAWQPLFDARGCLRTTPQRHDAMDAFFAARFIRREDA